MVVLGLRALLCPVLQRRGGLGVQGLNPDLLCQSLLLALPVEGFQGLDRRLAHWQAERIQLDPELLKNLQSTRPYWDRETVDLIYREQDNTNYSLVTIQAAYFIFLGVILLHGIVIFVLKRNLSTAVTQPHVRSCSASWPT